MGAINEKPEDLINAMPWIKVEKDIKNQIITFVLESEIQSEVGEIHLWTIRNNSKKELVGLLGVDQMTHHGGIWNFGYWVKNSYQKKGVASKSISSAIKWLSQHYDKEYIEITVKPDNIPGLATCKQILRHLSLNQNEFLDTILNHNGKEICYRTYLIQLDKS
ncbi:MAG: hypothetical protein CMB56_003115 [Methanobacteriota archaeon]|nr:MAG: hypothetical protein CMB56_003115 [Euryarchaeota archaeon]|tara:strand:- start:2689 stop:3177 length:489 start_codon:yes stop_codon:yes gene_type:complete